jgi:hypothetical protein
MAIRFATASSLALAVALLAAPVARAQNFFSFYEMSPRQIVGMLADGGYELRGPMIRRGDVYVCNVDSVSGRSMRLIVSAHDGRVLGRFAEGRRSRYDEDARVMRPPHDFNEGDDRDSDEGGKRQDRTAFGDVLNPPSRTYGNDSMFSTSPTPPERVPEGPKAKRQTAKKHHHSNVAKAPAATPATEATPTTEAAVSPAAEGPKPSTGVESVKPAETPRVVETPKAAEAPKTVEPKTVDKPVEAPKAAAPAEPAQAKAEIEKKPEPVKPKPESAHKKINDLPVGTLD